MESFEAADIPLTDMLHDGPAHLHVSGYFNMPGLWNGQLGAKLEALRNQRQLLGGGTCTTTISLVPQHDASGDWDSGLMDMLPLLDFLIMNDLETQHMTGTDLTNDELLLHAARFFESKSPTLWVIVTRGKDGAAALQGGQVLATQGAVVVEPVDPTGAGDAFASGFLHGIWKSKRDAQAAESPLWSTEAVRAGLLFGCAVATCSVSVRGASVPSTPQQINKVLEATASLSG